MRAFDRWLRLRYVVAFAATLIVLLTVGRGFAGRASPNNHFVHLAQGWLEGRTALAGEPPGWEAGRADDWARVTTLELRSGDQVRGQRCTTRACRDEAKRDRVQLWWTTNGELLRIAKADIVERHATWYVGFPPGPALLMLPGVLLWGLRFSDIVLTAIVGALVPVVLLWFLDRERGRRRSNMWCAAAWALGSPALFVAAHGSVWFTAHIVAALGLSLYLVNAWGLRRPQLAGWCLGLAVACRPHLLVAAILFGAIWWSSPRRVRDLLHFVVPIAVVLVGLGMFNEIRFDDAFEFGHRYLVVRWQPRMQEIGLFSLSYLPRNLACLSVLWPQWTGGWPPVRVSIHGLGLLWSTPWLIGLVRRGSPVPHGWALLTAAALVSGPALLYQNSGQLQFTYRFALDWLPLAVAALGLGSAADRPRVRVAIVVAIVIQLYGAWMFARAPEELFVLEPLGWPFAEEFND